MVGDEQVVADLERVVHAPDLMALGAQQTGEQLLAGLRPCVVWALGLLLLLVEPGLELALGEGDDPGPHVGVGQAAELLALAVEDARVVGLDRERVHAAGNDVTGSVQRRDPERVDDVP